LAAYTDFVFEAGAKRNSLALMHAADVFPKAGTSVSKSRLGRRWRWIKFAGVVLLLLHLITQRSLAIDITTTDGHTYKGCTISQVEPDALRIIHSDGAARIPYEKLPTALQKQYFDPAKIMAYREQVEEAKRLAAARADEERRQRQIAAAQAEEEREAEAEAHRRQEQETKTAAQEEEQQRLNADHREAATLHTLMLVGGILSIFLYFLPTFIGRRKANAAAIFALNLFLGWTFLGWALALVWACTQDSAMDVLARQHLNRPPPQPPPPRPYPEHDPLPRGEPYADRGALRDREGRYLE